MTINIQYYCSYCKKKLEGKLSSDMPRESYTQDELRRVSDYFLSSHKHREHTYCVRCKKKITPQAFEKREWGIRIIGKDIGKPEKPGDSGFKIYTGIFCKSCIDFIDQ